MAKKRKNTHPAYDIYRLAKQELPKEMIDSIRKMSELYRFPSKTLFRSRKKFSELFYSDKTSVAVRNFMIWAGLHQSEETPKDLFYYSPSVRKTYGVGHFLINLKMDRNYNPVGFELVADTKKTRFKGVPVKWTPEISNLLKYAPLDKLSGNVVQQALRKGVETKRALKLSQAIFEIMRWITAVKVQIETTIRLHDVTHDYISSPDADNLPEDELITATPFDVKNAKPYSLYRTEDGKFKIKVGNIWTHMNHYVNEADKIRYFVDVCNATPELEGFLVEYVHWVSEVYDISLIEFDSETEANIKRREIIVNGGVACLDLLMQFADKISNVRIDTKHGRQRLKKVRPTHKIPRVLAHETNVKTRLQDNVIIQKGYYKSIEETKAKLEKWRRNNLQ